MAAFDGGTGRGRGARSVVSGTKAEWHLADLTDSGDPFEQVIYSTGIEIDLTASEEELCRKWIELGYRESALLRQGLQCQLKDDGQECLTCPQATLDRTDRMNRLCRVGKDQGTIEKRVNALTEARVAPLREIAEELDAAQEMGDRPDDLAELLTSVGL